MRKTNKKWRIGYYICNLTQWVEKDFYTEFGAMLYAFYVKKMGNYKCYFRELC